jgi:hypothetical protein
MPIGRPEMELKNRDDNYSKLLNHWKRAISMLSGNNANMGLSSYALLPNTEEDVFCFSIFGIKCFMRFRHNIEQGVIEYGVIKRDDRSGNEIWIPITRVSFDYLGNLSSPYMTHHMGEYNRVHLLILWKHSAEFVKAAYDTGATQ